MAGIVCRSIKDNWKKTGREKKVIKGNATKDSRNIAEKDARATRTQTEMYKNDGNTSS